MPRRFFLVFSLLACGACNAASPTELADFNVVLIDGRWIFSFSGAACAPPEIELTMSRFQGDGGVPAEVSILGSWQTVGESAVTDLNGTVQRDSGALSLELIDDVRWIDGIFLDVDNVAAAYRDTNANCQARASGRRVE